MTTGAWFFMVASWTFVLTLAGWSYWRILRLPGRGDRGSDGD